MKRWEMLIKFPSVALTVHLRCHRTHNHLMERRWRRTDRNLAKYVWKAPTTCVRGLGKPNSGIANAQVSRIGTMCLNPPTFSDYTAQGVGSLAEVATGGPLQMPLRRCFWVQYLQGHAGAGYGRARVSASRLRLGAVVGQPSFSSGYILHYDSFYLWKQRVQPTEMRSCTGRRSC